MVQLAFPAVLPQKLRFNFLERLRELGLQEFVANLSQRFLLTPAISLLRSAVPKRNHALEVSNQNRVMSDIKERSLLLQHGGLRPQLLFDTLMLGDIADRARNQVSVFRL